jgi:dCMP deaminase
VGRPTIAQYGLALARAAASRSEDPVHQVGAVVLGPGGEVLGTGYNGTPAGAPPLTLGGWGDRDLVRQLTVHAEANALRYVRPGEATLLVSTMQPCVECLKATRAMGIREVAFGDLSGPRWDVPGYVADFFGMKLRRVQ